MSEEEVIEQIESLIDDRNSFIDPTDKSEDNIFRKDKKALQTLLQLLEQKDKRIDELEKALVDEAIKSTEKINKLKNRLKSDIEIGLKELKNEEWYTQKYAVFSNCVEYANEILKMLEE